MPEVVKTMSEVRKKGISALNKALGPVDAVRFLMQFDKGMGDYTADRRKILGNPSVAEVLTQVKAMRKKRRH